MYLYIDRKNDKFSANSKIALGGLARVAPTYHDRVNFFYVERPEHMSKRTDHGIQSLDYLPAFTIVTPAGHTFPLDKSISLGDASTIDKIIDD